MRRPRFKNWVRKELLQLSHEDSFSLRKLAALAQSDGSPELIAALLLYSHDAGCLERLSYFIYDDNIRHEYDLVERHLGPRDIERLALRGTPMMSLPETYRNMLAAYERAYHTPENNQIEKNEILERTRRTLLLTGTSPAKISQALGIDKGNLSAYLTKGEINRITLEAARRIEEYLCEQ